MSKEALAQKEQIVERLKENGCRITKQRLILLDVILGSDCGSCKEIYYCASKIDNSIGTATVYRMINTLEEIGAINRKKYVQSKRIICTRSRKPVFPASYYRLIDNSYQKPAEWLYFKEKSMRIS